MSDTFTEQSQTALERWTVDPERTIVEFEVEHLWGLHTVHGRFTRFEGSYVREPDGARVELAIDAASVDTGNDTRDRHLRSWDFLHVVPNPHIRFMSTDVTWLSSDRVHLRGELEAAGSSVPVEFEASVRRIDDEIEVEATTTVDQRRFDMSDGPLGNVKPPTKVHVKTRLLQEEGAC